MLSVLCVVRAWCVVLHAVHTCAHLRTPAHTCAHCAHCAAAADSRSCTAAGPLPEPLLDDARLQAAVQICYGEADPWTPPARVRALERFRSVRSVVGLPGVGHCPHDEAPELVNPMIVDFVRSLNVEAKAAA